MIARFAALLAGATLVGGCAAAYSDAPATAQPEVAQANGDDLGLATLPMIGEVDERYISYNVEMVEVTGGRFWAPFDNSDGETYRMRGPEDLGDQTLRNLARHLGPAYMRVSGTWANTTYLAADGEDISEAPEGYNQLLTRDQWRSALDFAEAVDAKIGVSFAVSPGARDADGVWLTEQAQRLVDLTTAEGSELAFAEFINEPNAAAHGGLPDGYSVADYTRDFALFKQWAAQAAPDMIIAGPGGVGESNLDAIPVASLKGLLLTEQLMTLSPDTVDAVSYHFYGAVSERCAFLGPDRTAKRDAALSPEWLDKTLTDYEYYAGLRDRYEPGDPLWVTETAQAACGGSRWAADFVDTFRLVNQFGLLAQRDVDVIFHNTLAASDYSLIEEETNEPRPNYWAAVLWNRLMGTRVLASPVSPQEGVRVYAHCLADGSGGVGLAVINLSEQPASVTPGRGAEAWVMTADSLDSGTMMINGNTPGIDANGELTGLEPVEANGEHTIPGQSIAMFSAPNASNAACR